MSHYTKVLIQKSEHANMTSGTPFIKPHIPSFLTPNCFQQQGRQGSSFCSAVIFLFSLSAQLLPIVSPLSRSRAYQAVLCHPTAEMPLWPRQATWPGRESYQSSCLILRSFSAENLLALCEIDSWYLALRFLSLPNERFPCVTIHIRPCCPCACDPRLPGGKLTI
jgi:hypothetical protein